MIETSDMNLAAYMKVLKRISTAGHRINERQLLLQFDITPEELKQYKEEYINSAFADYDATKRNFLRLLK